VTQIKKYLTSLLKLLPLCLFVNCKAECKDKVKVEGEGKYELGLSPEAHM
jgi:hypothetical protein